MSNQFRNVIYLSDVSGTGFWRHIQQVMATNSVSQQQNIFNTYTQLPILDQNYYKGITSITVQRWISDQQAQIFTKLFKPLADQNAAWLIYGIDDAMHYDEIPLYNRGRAAFANDQIQNNIKTMLNTADFVIVTTQHIKEYYHEKYGVPLENIIAAPNLLPKWWFGDRYEPAKKLDQFKKFKAKPRIGIVSSLSHYNVDKVRVDANGKAVKEEKDQNGNLIWKNQDGVVTDYAATQQITDDFDDIADCVRSTVNDFQWVCFGYCPPQIKDLADAKKIEVHGGISILNYPSVLENLQLQAVVAPIKKMEFNFCKSHIKYMECAATGIPLFATNCLPYSRVMHASQLFDTADDLKDKLLKLKFMSVGAYTSIIEDQWKWFNTPCNEGDFQLRNYWLEDNIGMWIDMFKLRNKTLTISMENVMRQKIAKAEAEKKNTLYKNDNILITK